ncbi:DUF4177 domain-containing protein [Nocardia salmonicida]|uniref:DUF4177 domain-containing protein n=1 Tax=Nocardia salmonicida TaxID=53431 RepID=UPI003CFB59D8
MYKVIRVRENRSSMPGPVELGAASAVMNEMASAGWSLHSVAVHEVQRVTDLYLTFVR